METDGMFVVAIVALSLFFVFGLPMITAIVLGYKWIGARHTERIGLINQGIMPESRSSIKKPNPNRLVSLRNGIVLAFLAIGIVAGFLLPNLSEFSTRNGGFEIDGYLIEIATGGFFTVTVSIVFFLGLGYLTYFFVSRKMEKEEEEIEDEFTQR
jgi:hypothetical protein